MTTIFKWCSSHLQGEQYPITRNKTTYFHMHISISKSVIPLCCKVSDCSILHLEYSKNIEFVAISPCYNPTIYTSCESLKNMQFSTASHLTIIKKTSTNHITNRYWISSSACPYQGYGAMAIFLAWAVVKARKISRIIKLFFKHLHNG